MHRRTFVAISGSALLQLSPTLWAQGQITIRRIGFLTTFPRADAESFLVLVRPNLEQLGWRDGRNIVLLAPRSTEGENDRLPAVAAELVSQGPDLILVQSVPATRALMQATKSIPIVMVSAAAPVELGLISDYRKPGGNVTGSSYPADELGRKLLQFLKEAAPRLRSIAVFVNPSNPAAPALVKQMRLDAPTVGMQAQIVDVAHQGDFESAFEAIRRANTHSILLPPEALIQSNRGAIADFAQAQGIPLVVVGGSGALPASGLMAYGPIRAGYAQLTARYVDRILKGDKPGDLPVEQPSRFNLVINLKTATALGITIPQSLLQRADEVIQ